MPLLLLLLLLRSEGELLTAAACTWCWPRRGSLSEIWRHDHETDESEGWSGIFVDICTGYWFVNRVREMRWTHVKNYGTHCCSGLQPITTFFVRGRGGWNSGLQPHSWFPFCLDKIFNTGRERRGCAPVTMELLLSLAFLSFLFSSEFSPPITSKLYQPQQKSLKKGFLFV